MSLLLDTNAFVWWSRGDKRLSSSARSAISSAANIHVSVATAWEIAIKVGKGRWPEAKPLLERFEIVASDQGIALVPIAVDDVRRAGLIRGEVNDPFDKLISAQALNSSLGLVSSDQKIASLGARIVW